MKYTIKKVFFFTILKKGIYVEKLIKILLLKNSGQLIPGIFLSGKTNTNKKIKTAGLFLKIPFHFFLFNLTKP